MRSSSRWNQTTILCLLLVFTGGLAFHLSLARETTQAASATPKTVSNVWSVVLGPLFASGSTTTLSRVSALSPSNIWAVGYVNNSGIDQALIEHWDGSSWSIVPSPTNREAGFDGSVLNDVSALSPSDVWAVGFYYTSGVKQTLIEHWDGTGWTVISSPSPANFSVLLAVSARSTTDVWAVGYDSDCQMSCGSGAVIEHWNGSTWSVTTIPNSLDYLYQVTAVSANDAWTMGYAQDNTGNEVFSFVHWDGIQWSVFPTPSVGVPASSLNGIASVKTHLSGSNLWAVGSSTTSSKTQQTLIAHWKGSGWSVIPSPNVGSMGSVLNGVVALSASDVWAVGYFNNSSNQEQTLVEHWNGKNWRIVPSPNPGTINTLSEVARIPGTTQIWTMGSTSGNTQLLIEFCC